MRHEHLPKEKEGTAEEQQQYLQSVFIGKNVLICIDGKAHELRTVLIFVLSYDSSKDCWDQAHYRCFDVIDKQTASMILVSTRISGLISSNACVEVKLSLMSVQVSVSMALITLDRVDRTNELQESVEMLASASGLDSAAVPPAMVEVVSQHSA